MQSVNLINLTISNKPCFTFMKRRMCQISVYNILSLEISLKRLKRLKLYKNCKTSKILKILRKALKVIFFKLNHRISEGILSHETS